MQGEIVGVGPGELRDGRERAARAQIDLITREQRRLPARRVFEALAREVAFALPREQRVRRRAAGIRGGEVLRGVVAAELVEDRVQVTGAGLQPKPLAGLRERFELDAANRRGGGVQRALGEADDLRHLEVGVVGEEAC